MLRRRRRQRRQRRQRGGFERLFGERGQREEKSGRREDRTNQARTFVRESRRLALLRVRRIGRRVGGAASAFRRVGVLHVEIFSSEWKDVESNDRVGV